MATPIQAHFIYTPKSGDRCLAVVPTEECIVVTWPNQSRHAVGRLRQVEIEAAQQGRWFRRDAREVAKALVEGIGGVAYDDCGMIVLIVPDGWQQIAVDLVSAAETQHPEDLCRVAREMAQEAEERDLSSRCLIHRDAARHAKYKDLEPISVEGGVQ